MVAAQKRAWKDATEVEADQPAKPRDRAPEVDALAEGTNVDGVVLAAGRSRRMGRSKPLLRVHGGGDTAARAAAGEDGEAASKPHRRTRRGREVGTGERETFLERAVRHLTAGGCRSVTVVIAAGDERVQRLARTIGAHVIENPEPDSQPIDSVRLAIASLPHDSSAVAVLPVDVPLVTTATAAAVVEAFAARRAPIVAPSYRGELGHPVLIARSLFHAAMSGPLEEGLRSLLDRRRDEIEAVHVDDRGTLIDIDTMDDYDRFIAR